MQNIRENSAKNVINDLLKISNKVTTLEIKMECINRFPEFYWKQQDVKSLVDKLVNSGDLYVSDSNGVYQTYSVNNALIVTRDIPTKSMIGR